MKIALLLIIFFFACTFGVCQKIGTSYFSYPDRKLELQYNDSIILWINHFPHIGKEHRIFIKYKSVQKNDTTYIIESDHNIEIGIIKIIKKKHYLSVYYSKDYAELFKKNSLSFKIFSNHLYNITDRNNRELFFDLERRLERLKIFNQTFDNPLPKIGESGL